MFTNEINAIIGKDRPSYYGVGYDFFDTQDLDAKHFTFNVTGTSPQAIIDAVGGQATLTTGGTTGNRNTFHGLNEFIKLEKASRYFANIRFKLDHASLSDFGFGIGVIKDEWLGSTNFIEDGVFFWKPAATTGMDLAIAKNAGEVADYELILDVLVADTEWHTASFLIETDADNATNGTVTVWIDGVRVAHQSVTGLPDDEELTIIGGVRTSSGAARVLTMDYIGAGGLRKFT